MSILLLLLLATFPLMSVAQETCPVPQSMNDILECLKERHQAVLLKALEARSTKNLDEVLGQRPNPLLGIQSVHSSNSRQTQLVLSQKLDLGGRLKALRSKGVLLHQVKLNELDHTKEDIIEAVLLNIHHLIHINETLKVNREVFSSLNKVINALRKRPALSPEQEASLLNFKLQQAEVRNLISLLEDEEEEVLLFFQLNGGYRKDDILRVMEDHHHPLEIIRIKQSLSVNLRRIGLMTKFAEKELEVQKALPWEGVSIGPMFVEEKFDEVSEKLYGVSLTFPIPLWQINTSGKQQASVKLSNMKSQFSLIQHKEDLEKGSILSRVNKLKTTLGDLPGNEELFKTHLRFEKLYNQGLISANSFLDSHRIWRDVISTKLELEEKILQLTIQYYRLTGNLNEVHL